MTISLGAFFLDASALLACEDSRDEHYRAMRELVTRRTRLLTLDLARYETANVAIRSWRNPAAAHRVHQRIASLEADNGVMAGDSDLVVVATAVAQLHSITVYDASYVAAADSTGAQLVSCDVRDLVSKGLAVLPRDALAAAK